MLQTVRVVVFGICFVGASFRVLAARKRPRLEIFSPFPKEEGDGAPKGASFLSFTHLFRDAWRLSARRPALSRQPG
ncbi:MAG: hypothetical protein PSV22_01730, partial [Pseudolabrys sp.]|nr:hypothetical protein [Pseudolabrys sp.]